MKHKYVEMTIPQWWDISRVQQCKNCGFRALIYIATGEEVVQSVLDIVPDCETYITMTVHNL